MNRRAFERHLRSEGCVFIRHGAAHAIWRSAAGDRQASVPRHRVLAMGTVRAICRQLSVRFP